MKDRFWPFTEVQNGNRHEVMRKSWIRREDTTDHADITDNGRGSSAVEAVLSAALLQDARGKAATTEITSVLTSQRFFQSASNDGNGFS